MRRGRHRQISDGATLGTAVFETVLNPNAMPAQRERHLGCSARLWRSLPGGADILVCLGSASAGCTHPAEPTRRNEEGTRMSLRRTGRQECLPHQVATNTSYTRAPSVTHPCAEARCVQAASENPTSAAAHTSALGLNHLSNSGVRTLASRRARYGAKDTPRYSCRAAHSAPARAA